MAVCGQFQGDGVVKIFGIITVDGDAGKCAQIQPVCEICIRDLFRQCVGAQQDLWVKFLRNIVSAQYG